MPKMSREERAERIAMYKRHREMWLRFAEGEPDSIRNRYLFQAKCCADKVICLSDNTEVDYHDYRAT